MDGWKLIKITLSLSFDHYKKPTAEFNFLCTGLWGFSWCSHKETALVIEFVNNQANSRRIQLIHVYLVFSEFLVRFTGTLGSTRVMFLP